MCLYTENRSFVVNCCYQVNKDGSGYPPNSLVVGMFDGYYTHVNVPGVMVPPKVMHSMMDLLPPMSLLEVNKSEVRAYVCLSVCSPIDSPFNF